MSQRSIPATGPIDSFRDGMVEGWNSTRQNHGMAGNREAGGFVNSTVTAPLSRWPHSSRPFHDLTGTIPLFHRSIPEAINRETVLGWGGSFLQAAFWEQPVTKELCE